jgi:hypothetical protein
MEIDRLEGQSGWWLRSKRRTELVVVNGSWIVRSYDDLSHL